MPSDFGREIELALKGSGEVSGTDYLRWARSGDLASRARAYALSALAWSRIVPEPTMEQQCTFMARYLMQCVVENPVSDGYLHTGFEAAYALADWLKHLVTVGGTGPTIAAVATSMAETYKQSTHDARERIETGALEHILEAPLLRPYFETWNSDPVLVEAYRRALEWGLAHPDAT